MLFLHTCRYRISSVLFVSLLYTFSCQVSSQPSTAFLTNSVPNNSTNSTHNCTVSIGVADSLLVLIPPFLLGSNYFLLKHYNRGDGVFFQWMVCAGVWICGLCVNFIQSSPNFYIIAAIGGVIWAFGNFLLIPMLRLVGFHTGLLMWSLVFMISGWLTGFLKLMGVTLDRVCVPFFNYGGIVMCVSGVILLAFLREKRADNTPNTGRRYHDFTSIAALYNTKTLLYYNPQLVQQHKFGFEGRDIAGRLLNWLSPLKRKLIGFLLSILMGVAWGLHFLPMQCLQVVATFDKYYSENPLDYIFPYATGAFVSSTLLTVLYSIYMFNKPRILPQSVLPALAVGVLTGVAISLWAYLNERMSSAVTFPVIASGTPTIGVLFSIIEYRGCHNCIIFMVAVSVILSGMIMVLLSKVHPFFVFFNFHG